MFLNKTIFKKGSIILAASFSCSVLLATEIASEQIWGNDVQLQPTVEYDEASLRVSGDNAAVSQSFNAGDEISISLLEMEDGLYHYHLSLSTNPAEGTDSQQTTEVEQSGQFRIINGTASAYNDEIAEAEAAEESALMQAELDANNAEASVN